MELLATVNRDREMPAAASPNSSKNARKAIGCYTAIFNSSTCKG
jgi:hypothetical protein